MQGSDWCIDVFVVPRHFGGYWSNNGHCWILARDDPGVIGEQCGKGGSVLHQAVPYEHAAQNTKFNCSRSKAAYFLHYHYTPYPAEQGIILTQHGSLVREQRILSAGIKVTADDIFDANEHWVIST